MADSRPAPASAVPLTTIAREWLRLGTLGFGGPPAHIAMLEKLCVRDRRWLSEAEFGNAVAAVNLLPGPASTQLAIYCAWRLRGVRGGLLGGFCFIAPGAVAVLALAVPLLRAEPNRLLFGAAAGAGAAVGPVALHAAAALVPASWHRAGPGTAARVRWSLYAAAGAVATVLLGAWVALVILVCGAVEAAVRSPLHRHWVPPLALGLPALVPAGTLAGLCYVAVKVGALSYGGGFVIVPLMQTDAVSTYHWLTDTEFTTAVALGQVTPGPVVHTMGAVGYGAAGLGGGLLALVIAFAPSFLFVLVGGRSFDRLHDNERAQAFLTGAGPAAIGAIGGSAVLLSSGLGQPWQFGVLAAAALWLLVARRGVVSALVGAGAVGLAAALLHWPLP